MTLADWPTTDLVTSRVASTPDRLALIDGETGRQWTYRELDRDVDAVAGGIDAVGADRLAILVPTGPSFVRAAFAAMRRGVTLVPLSPSETAGELAPKVSQADPGAILCTDETATVAAELGATGIDGVYTLDESTGDGIEALPTETTDRDPAELDPSWTQLICFTSGTSGRPKGVKLTVSNLLESASASAYRLGVDQTDRWLVPLPMNHMGGFAPMIRSARYGTTVVPLGSSDPDRIVSALETHACTGISLVPTMLRRLLDAGWEPCDALRFVLVGGAPTPPSLVDRALAAGVPIHPTYGATETSSQVATATPEQVERWPNTVGQPLIGTTVSIVDRDGEPVEAGATGEVVVAGPTVSPGYLDADQTDRAFENGRFLTGDVGYVDEDGRLWVTGRRSDRIVTGGETVDPESIRRVLVDHPAVVDAAVVGLADDEWGQRVGAAVVPDRDGQGPTRDAITTFCRDRLAPYKRPRTIEIVDELPRTRSGTVDRDAVREQLESE